jgi:ribosomal protein S25
MKCQTRTQYNKHARETQNEEIQMAYTLDTKVGDILKDTGAVKVLEKYAPGVSKNPMIGLAKGMTLKTLIAMPQAKEAGITEDMVKKVLAEINALKK